MTSDIRKCEVCGKSYEEARRLLNEALRSNIIIPKISELQSEKYRESLQKLLAEVRNLKKFIEKEDLPNYSLRNIKYWHDFDKDSTLSKFLSDHYGYISENELIWFERYVKQVCSDSRDISANEALQGMQTWLETEIKENVGDPGGFSKSVDEAIEEASDKYSMHTKTVSLKIDGKEKLSLLLYKWPGSDFANLETYRNPYFTTGINIKKTINMCWICSSLFDEASNTASNYD